MQSKIQKINFHKKTILFFALLILAGIFLDQAVKIWIRTYFELYEKVEVIPYLFNLTYHVNRGAAFSFLSKHNYGLALLTAISWLSALAIIVYFIRSFLKEEQAFTAMPWLRKNFYISLALLLMGDIGNGIDRLFLGAVTDMFDFYLGHNHFAIFNVADVFVCLGCFLLITVLIIEERKKS